MLNGFAIIQYLGFVLAQIINAVLLFLLNTRANHSFGKYRILMIIFSVFAMIYSVIEFLTLPVMLCKGRSLCVCSDGPLKHYRPIGVPLTSLYCGSFGMCISLLALHFYYRYVAVCKPEKLYYFDGNRILLTIIPCIGVFTTWTLTVYFLMGPTQEKEKHYHDVLLKYFHSNSYEVSFIAMIYKTSDTESEPGRWIPSQIMACFILSLLLYLCFSTIVFCGFNSLKQMNVCPVHMSAKTKELNRQLFLTLGVQTILPLITMYLPVGSFIILPFFGVELGINANKTGAFVGMYPALDPLVAILLIKDFRNYVLCKKQRGLVDSATNMRSTQEKYASSYPAT